MVTFNLANPTQNAALTSTLSMSLEKLRRVKRRVETRPINPIDYLKPPK